MLKLCHIFLLFQQRRSETVLLLRFVAHLVFNQEGKPRGMQTGNETLLLLMEMIAPQNFHSDNDARVRLPSVVHHRLLIALFIADDVQQEFNGASAGACFQYV